MIIEEAIKKRILELCKKDNLTVNDLSYKAGMTQSTLESLTDGTSKNPKIKTLILIAAAFNMSISEFLNTDEINNANLEIE